MCVSCKKFWNILIGKGIKKDLLAAAGINKTDIAKLGNNENVTTDILVKVYKTLKLTSQTLWKL